MDRRRGLTRVELLVVAGIIGLILFLMLPMRWTSRHREPPGFLCQMNLKRWGLVFKLYTDDYDASFISGEGGDSDKRWFEPLRPRHEEHHKLWLCPLATTPHVEGGRNPFGAWKVGDVSGSYGLNGWVCNPQQGKTELPGRGPAENCWGTTRNVRGSNDIPILADAMWFDGWPRQTDEPPPDENWPGNGVDQNAMKANQNEMRRFCVNRHHGRVNVLFMDFSVGRRVGLKELWTLKWHRNYDTSGPWTRAGGVQPTDWPAWMRNFRDF
jgi:hypothetical protein